MKNVKVINYTNDISKLLHHHNAKLTTKLAYVLALTISQPPDVRTSIITKAIHDEFNFLFDYPKKKFNDDFKQTLRTVLIDALTHNYDETQAKMHVYGYILEKALAKEMAALHGHLIVYDKNKTLPERSRIPQLSSLIDKIESFQNRFASIDNFHTQTRWEIAKNAIRNASHYGISENQFYKIYYMIIGFIIFGVIQFGAALIHFLQPNTHEDDSTSNMIKGLIIVDLVAMIAIYKLAGNLTTFHNERKVSALQQNANGLTNILPKLITHEIKVKDTVSYSYSLPLFKSTEPPIKTTSSTFEPDDKFKARTAPEKLKSRPLLPMRLFQRVSEHELELSPSNKKQIDEIVADGVTYRRMYNGTVSTKKFVGYTQAELKKHTQPANRETFKSLLETPRIVPPKHNQGFVRASLKGSSAELANFKLKYHGDTRLLFSRVKEQALGDETIKLYLLSDSKTHKQIDRKKR